MRIARGTALALLAAIVAAAPAWAQDMQQGPPPMVKMARMMGGPQVTCRTGGPGGNRMFYWRQRGMGGPGNGMFFERFREGGGPMGMAFGHGAEMGFRVDRLLNNPVLRQRLGITDAQAAKIRQQTTAFQIAQIHSRADLQVDALQLRDLITAQTPDRAAIDQKLDEMGATRLAQSKARVDYMLTLRSDLTPEQLQKLRQMREAPVRGGAWRGHAAPPAAAPSTTQPNP